MTVPTVCATTSAIPFTVTFTDDLAHTWLAAPCTRH